MMYSKIIILVSAICSMFILLMGCGAHSIILQPHVGLGDAVGILKGKKAGVFIPSDLLTLQYEKYSMMGGGIIIPLGSPVRDLALETFLPFYDQVTQIADKDYEGIDHLIEVNLDNFEVTGGLDTIATISCTISDNEGQIFSGSWEGKGSSAGFWADSLAREEIRKSSSEALTQAFLMLRAAYIEYIKNNPYRFK